MLFVSLCQQLSVLLSPEDLFGVQVDLFFLTNITMCLAGEPEFEPGLTESESAVLPLYYSPPFKSVRVIS